MTAKLSTARAPRADNRLPAVLDAAARLFAGRGYSATSMRDIAEAVDMLPGSLYYHFAAKEDLLVAVYEAGVRAIADAAQAAAGREKEPWARLEAACAAHLEAVLQRSDYAQVLIRVLPQDVPAVAVRLRALRRQYERVFRELVGALPLAARAERKVLRLMLLGALNWSRFWFDPEGSETPKSLARKFVTLLKESQNA
ncbi:MAG TPA: TetR/AcrR family transcriptional regulator [Burkholderiales bacterium]|nr:TetR/AcrR family transcriptional regulator [Burkholderiales bacterium]